MCQGRGLGRGHWSTRGTHVTLVLSFVTLQNSHACPGRPPPSVPHQHRAAFSQQVFGLGTTKGALAGGVGGRIYSLLPHLPGSLRVTKFTPEINTGTFTPWRDFSWRPSRRVTPATELGDREKLGLKATCSDVVSRLPRCPHLCLF